MINGIHYFQLMASMDAGKMKKSLGAMEPMEEAKWWISLGLDKDTLKMKNTRRGILFLSTFLSEPLCLSHSHVWLIVHKGAVNSVVCLT